MQISNLLNQLHLMDDPSKADFSPYSFIFSPPWTINKEKCRHMGGSHSNKLIFLIFNMLGLIDMKIMRISTPYTPKDANKKSHLTFCFLKAKTRFFMTHVFCNAFCFLFGVVFLIGLLRLICLPWEFNLQLVCAGACRSSQDSHIPICIYLSPLRRGICQQSMPRMGFSLRFDGVNYIGYVTRMIYDSMRFVSILGLRILWLLWFFLRVCREIIHQFLFTFRVPPKILWGSFLSMLRLLLTHTGQLIYLIYLFIN